MGWRVRRSRRIGPVRINIGKQGISSISGGRRGLTINAGRRGVQTTVSAPGTGVSYTRKGCAGCGSILALLAAATALLIVLVSCAEADDTDDATAAPSTATESAPEPTEIPPTATVPAPTNAPATATVRAEPTSTPAPQVEVTIDPIAPVPVNGNATVTATTTPGASCTIRYFTPSGSASDAEGLEEQVADAEGRLSWIWVIGPRTRPGTGLVKVTCGDSTAEADIEVREGA